MKTKTSKWIKIFLESVNYIIITYVVSNMAILLRQNWLFIPLLHLKYGLRKNTGKGL